MYKIHSSLAVCKMDHRESEILKVTGPQEHPFVFQYGNENKDENESLSS